MASDAGVPRTLHCPRARDSLDTQLASLWAYQTPSGWCISQGPGNQLLSLIDPKSIRALVVVTWAFSLTTSFYRPVRAQVSHRTGILLAHCLQRATAEPGLTHAAAAAMVHRLAGSMLGWTSATNHVTRVSTKLCSLLPKS